MKKVLLIFTLFFTSYLLQGQLVAGDIAFIGVNEDAGPAAGQDHSFSFITLTTIPANTVIYFTEQGWNDNFTPGNGTVNGTADGFWMDSNEGHFSWTAPSGGVSCGTVIRIYETGIDVINVDGVGTVSGIISGTGWNLLGGDQVIAYQASTVRPNSVVPTFIAAIHTDDGQSISFGYDSSTGWSGSSYTDSGGSPSHLPPGLTNGVNAIALFNPTNSAFFEQDNVKYTGSLAGTSTALRALINKSIEDGGAWSTDNSTPFNITPAGYNPSVTCVAPCSPPDVPTVTFSPGTVCVGGSATLTISGNLNDATAWHIYTGVCGGTQIGTTTTGSFNVSSVTTTTTYFIRGEGGCITPGSCGSITVAPTALDNASFNYGAASYCANNPDPTPTITGVFGGIFSAESGLSINASTGAIDVSASTPGNYTVTYTTGGTCANSSSVSVTVNALDNASFSYSAPAYCVNDLDPTPTISGVSGGTFSSTAGLSINSSTGAIDVSASTAGTYVVTYTTSGTCPNSANVAFTVNELDNASFNYTAAAYCVEGSDPTPTITGLGSGTFSAGAGLSINASTGTIDVSASTPGNYTVTYTTGGTCPNSSNVSITVNALDDPSFSYGASSYNSNDADPSPTISGLAGGTFSSTAGLSINAGTGVIDISASTLGNYTVTYTTAGNCPNSSNVSVAIVTNSFTWTGTTNNDWDTATNWNPASIPSSTTDIIIPNGLTNYPTTSTAVSFNSMTINSGASFIAGANVTGPVTYKRTIPTTNWYLVSAPVAGESYADVLLNNSFEISANDNTTLPGKNVGFSLYSNNTGDAWNYASTMAGFPGVISPGLGASIKIATAGNDLTITGTINTSDVSFAIASGTRTDFSLLGNPFTSFVNSNIFTTANTTLLSEETIWLWDGTSYVTYNAVNPIELAPGQGFFIKGKPSGSGNISFATSNQSHQTTDTFMKGATTKAKTSFELFIDNNANTTSTKVFYIDTKTTGFDNGYDSSLFGGVENAFAVYTQLVSDSKGEKIAIQTLPNANLESMIIPVGLIADANKEITFSLKANNFLSGVNITLEDRVTNTFTRLDEVNSSYKFTTIEKVNGIGRFYMHTSSKALRVDAISLENIRIYKLDNTTLRIAGLSAEKITATLYNMLGKEVLQDTFNSNGSKDLALPRLAKGIYIVRLNTEAGNLTKKISIE